MDYKIVPMDKWPGEGKSPLERGHFSSTYARTLGHLEREVSYLSGSHVVFQLEVSEGDIRQDGRLYADRDPKYPGIVVTFNSKHGPLSYYCHHYSDWRSNLRAITITLQHLRKIDEHGVNKKGAQYEGYKRLNAAPAADNGRPKITTPEQAAAFVVSVWPEFLKAQLLTSSGLFQYVYKQSAVKLHPDTSRDYDEEKWIQLQEAAAVLRQHHGL